jgi:hypothetical protein
MSCTSFISADWSKDTRKRSVHVADVGARTITAEHRHSWTLEELLALAQRLSEQGPVLVGMDLALGVPAGFWTLVRRSPRWQGTTNFVEWLTSLGPDDPIWGEPVRTPVEWSVSRPFLRVPEGAGGLSSFERLVDGSMRRRIDKATGAKPLFAASGIPGTVGSGTKSLWLELSELLRTGRSFAIWPFEGALDALMSGHRVVLAETYPGLAYAAALEKTLPAAPLRVSKTLKSERQRACEVLERAPWVVRFGVDLGPPEPCLENEDAFDSHVTAAAVLRCLLEHRSLAYPEWIDNVVEGSMLLAGPVDLHRRSRRLNRGGVSPPSQLTLRDAVPRAVGSATRLTPRKRDDRERNHRCPIPGCTKEFRGSRGGWDSHVASVRMHPEWRPELTDAVSRIRAFREQFYEWLGQRGETDRQQARGTRSSERRI